MIRGKVEGGKPGDVQLVGRRLVAEAKKILKTEAVLMTSHIREKYMSGPRPVLLGVRTGFLRSSTKPLPVKEFPGGMYSGTTFGTAYARPHIGPKGQVTTIRPKSKRFLAIPLEAAMTRSGVPRGTPLSGPWGDTFFLRSLTKPGELILYGKMAYTKGAKMGQLKQGMRLKGGGIVPLFLMVKKVQIKSRVHPEVILAWEKPRMIAAFRAVGVRLTG